MRGQTGSAYCTANGFPAVQRAGGEECRWRGSFVPGEEGGEGKVAHSSRGRVTAAGGQMEEKHGLFPSLTGPSLRPEGNFRSSGSSRDSIAAAGGYSAYLRGETNHDLRQLRLTQGKKNLFGVFGGLKKKGVVTKTARRGRQRRQVYTF